MAVNGRDDQMSPISSWYVGLQDHNKLLCSFLHETVHFLLRTGSD